MFVNLNITGVAPGTVVSISRDFGNGTTREADGGGFCNFGVEQGPLTVTAHGYTPQTISVGETDVDVVLQSDTSALWPGVQPSPVPAAVKTGPWPDASTPNGLGAQRCFDLLTKGYTPQGAIDWQNAHGYPNAYEWDPTRAIIGFADAVYIGTLDGRTWFAAGFGG